MSTYLIEIKNVSKNFKSLKVIKDISLNIEKEKTYVLLGENGSGKSTFLKLLVGLYKPTLGVIKRNYKSFYYVPELLVYKDKIKVDKYLSRVTKLLNVKRDYKKEEHFKIQTNKYLSELSKGNQKKVLFYLAIIKTNEILFLDEPFDGLDKEIKLKFINYINHNKKITYVISTHDKKAYDLLEEKEVIYFD